MEVLDKTQKKSFKSVSDAFAGQSIFVTGATGFLGKVFIEKVLYSCPKLSKLFILIRENKNMGIQQRMTKMLEVPVFDRLRKERPEDLNKIVPILGDISVPNMGLKVADEELLLNTVSMVFHIAAIVKFNEKLVKILETNLKGTERIIDLCQRIKHLKAFVYVSTAFTNSNLDFVEERIYPSPISLEEAERVLDQKSDTETDRLQNVSLNSYALSKELAENYVAKFQYIIPSAIVRPSIVISAKAEPVEGWIDNWHGATGIVLPLAQGLNRAILSDNNYNIDLIPVDYAANTIIIAATKCSRSQGVVVYNCSTSYVNPITIEKFVNLCRKSCVQQKFYIMPFPYSIATSSKWLLNVIIFFQQIPATLYDWFLYIIGGQPRYVKYQQKSLKAQKIAEGITARSWEICAKQTCALSASLSESDKKCFACDPRSIVWEEFIPTYIKGIRKYLLRQ